LNVYTTIAIINTLLIILTAFTIYMTGSLFSLGILLFMASGGEDDKDE